MKLGIIGCGFVGKALDYGFSKNLNKYLVDPRLNTTIKSMYEAMVPDVIFVSVPTPMGADGQIDASIIESVFEELLTYDYRPIVVIKSTVTPAILQRINSRYPRLVFNPEFLTERNANWDFVNPDMLVLGSDSIPDMRLVKRLYDEHSNCNECPVYLVDLESASLVKYTLNCFLASKVLFFNQLHDIFIKSETAIDWNSFINIIAGDKRIGSSHMSVPGPDGRLGFGGACFTKDTAAMIGYAKSLGSPFTQLEETVRANQVIRNQYIDLDHREKEQNVKYNLDL
jgi:UDPglucose 6-dehydrogenase